MCLVTRMNFPMRHSTVHTNTVPEVPEVPDQTVVLRHQHLQVPVHYVDLRISCLFERLTGKKIEVAAESW